MSISGTATKYVITGGGRGFLNAGNYNRQNWNIWCIAKSYANLPFANKVFEVHQESSRWCRGTYLAHKERKLAVITPSNLLPNAEVIPKEVQEIGGLTCSISWMVAYALYLGATHLAFQGVDLSDEPGAEEQRSGLLYLLGYARAKGVNISIPSSSGLAKYL